MGVISFFDTYRTYFLGIVFLEADFFLLLLQYDFIFLPKGGIWIFLNGFTYKTHLFNTEGCSLSLTDLDQPQTIERVWMCLFSSASREWTETHQSRAVCLQGGIKKAREALQRKEWGKDAQTGLLRYCVQPRQGWAQLTDVLIVSTAGGWKSLFLPERGRGLGGGWAENIPKTSWIYTVIPDGIFLKN